MGMKSRMLHEWPAELALCTADDSGGEGLRSPSVPIRNVTWCHPARFRVVALEC